MTLEEAQKEPGQACPYRKERYAEDPSFRVAGINCHAFDYSCQLVFFSNKFCSGKDVMMLGHCCGSKRYLEVFYAN